MEDDDMNLLLAYWMQHNSQPAEQYIDLEWIASSGAQYIDTGIVPSLSTEVMLDVAVDSSLGNNTCFLGTRNNNSSSPATNVFRMYRYSSNYMASHGTTVISITISAAKIMSGGRLRMHFGKLDSSTWGLSGGQTLTTIDTVTYEGSAASLVLFAEKWGTEIKNNGYLKMWGCDIYENGVLVFSGRPKLRLRDNKPGLLDSVSGRFFANQGTGADFTYKLADDYDIDFEIIATAGQLYYKIIESFGGATAVDWGDGTIVDVVPVGESTTLDHTYQEAGTYRVRIRDAASIFNNTHYMKLGNGGSFTDPDRVAQANMVGTVYAFKNIGTRMWSYTFCGCTNAQVPYVPAEVDYMESYCLRDVIAAPAPPAGVATISTGAYRGCNNMTWDTLPSALTTLYTSAFYYARNLRVVHIPATVRSIASTAFSGCWRNTTGYTGQPHTIVFDGTPTSIASDSFSSNEMLADICVPWTEGTISGARWGATNAVVHYGYSPVSALPTGYTAVDYIESTGTQYIDTGVHPTSRYSIELKMSAAPSSGDKMFFGMSPGSSGARWWVEYYGSRLYASISAGSGSSNAGSAPSGTFVLTMSNTGGVSAGGTQYISSFGSAAFTTSLNAYLFCYNSNGTAAYFTSMKVWYLKISTGDVLIRDFVPCIRDTDDEPGLYDLCGTICASTGTPFYPNAGTGAFLYPLPPPPGPDTMTMTIVHPYMGTITQTLYKSTVRYNNRSWWCSQQGALSPDAVRMAYSLILWENDAWSVVWSSQGSGNSFPLGSSAGTGAVPAEDTYNVSFGVFGDATVTLDW